MITIKKPNLAQSPFLLREERAAPPTGKREKWFRSHFALAGSATITAEFAVPPDTKNIFFRYEPTAKKRSLKIPRLHSSSLHPPFVLSEGRGLYIRPAEGWMYNPLPKSKDTGDYHGATRRHKANSLSFVCNSKAESYLRQCGPVTRVCNGIGTGLQRECNGICTGIQRESPCLCHWNTILRPNGSLNWPPTSPDPQVENDGKPWRHPQTHSR